jgi:hypothetical protein
MKMMKSRNGEQGMENVAGSVVSALMRRIPVALESRWRGVPTAHVYPHSPFPIPGSRF